MRGYVSPGVKSFGSINQPSSLVVPFIQWKFRISPHAGLAPALTVVNCLHLPMGPPQTSGGAPADWRITAETEPSREREAEADAPTNSSPVQSDCTVAPEAFTVENPDLPSTFCVNII